jgi:hypothetical protein
MKKPQPQTRAGVGFAAGGAGGGGGGEGGGAGGEGVATAYPSGGDTKWFSRIACTTSGMEKICFTVIRFEGS